ncbi:hypothetical protein [Erythrobacter sp. HKB08]|uniref:hypothetical protein n=1 Tax=Erythrobacter sp. HKB08 TaxID=2502843 RepID=UPI001008768C|nr:hypothetical protein [Erythrobacter sp. HKB08]
MLYMLKAMSGDRLSVSFNASREFRVHIYEQPGDALPKREFEKLKADCEQVVRACLKGETLDYGLFEPESEAWSRSVITLVRRRDDGRPVAFNAMPMLDVRRGSASDCVLHLGLVMVDPDERSGGLSWILYGLTCFALFLRGRMRPVWVSSVTQVPAVVGMVAETFSSVFPAQQGTRQSFTHRHLAHQIMQHHRAAFGVGEDAGFDLDRQVITDAYTGGSDNLKKSFEVATKHRKDSYNDYCREELDYARGDDVLQIGAIDLAAGQRFLSRSVPRSALPQLMVQAVIVVTGAALAPLAQWLDASTPFGRLRASK